MPITFVRIVEKTYHKHVVKVCTLSSKSVSYLQRNAIQGQR